MTLGYGEPSYSPTFGLGFSSTCLSEKSRYKEDTRFLRIWQASIWSIASVKPVQKRGGPTVWHSVAASALPTTFKKPTISRAKRSLLQSTCTTTTTPSALLWLELRSCCGGRWAEMINTV